MHRSGMLMGSLDRCVNGLPMAEVSRRYLWHTSWQSPEHPGGAEQELSV
jgi:nuclear transport factor 2 (NTF2) superfamily protein